MDYRKFYYKYFFKYWTLHNKLQIGGTDDDEEFFTDDSTSVPNYQFTIELFDNLQGTSNIFSPISIIFCLGLIQLSAAGRTDQQLTKILGHKYNLSELEYLYRTFNNSVMKITNAMIIDYDSRINEEYLDMINKLAIIINDHFTNSDLIVSKINSYIEKNTDGMIKDIVKPTDISNKTPFVLINTVYFKASWQNKFLASNTKKMIFNKINSNVVQMMHQIANFNYYSNGSVQMIELPYSEKDYVMGIILPKNLSTDSELEYSINNIPIFPPAEITELINNLEYKLVDLYLPRFTHRKNIQLPPILKKMGLFDIFDERADLDITLDKIPVSNIIHEAVVIVDENGTEAAAATIVTTTSASLGPSIKPEPIVFKADHAFIYYIRYVPNNLFLFYGDYQGN